MVRQGGSTIADRFGEAGETEPEWRESAVARCLDVLKRATATADRLALMRSLVRLLGGRLALAELGLTLTQDELDLLTRFGLAASGDADALRLATEHEALPGLNSALVLDTSDRQLVDTACPDGILLRFTDHSHYRSEAQKAAVRALVTQPPGGGLMVSLPTGAGKSLLFQLAALHGRSHEPGACAIVITPTIALALDHERTLRSIAGLEGSRALTGDTTPTISQEIVDAFRRGEVPVLFLSPEKALSARLLAFLAEAARPDAALYGLDARLTHVFVDEAHIIESWGRSFRPDFQRLPGLLAELRSVNPEVRAVLLSATLPPAARRVLQDSWKLGGEWLEVDAKTPRYEHDVIAAPFDDLEERDRALDYLLDRAPRPAIIYTTEVEKAHSLGDHLRDDRGYARLAVFTGETSPKERKDIIDGWAREDYDLVVATSAFGMGIDKSNVRTVIHACLPESPARWYQEIGRASRDRGQGLAACLFTTGLKKSDVSAAYSLATSGWLTRELAEDRWAKLKEMATNARWDETGRQCMTLNIDAVRDALKRQTSDYNRGWNMALLTLMQRAGVIQVRAVASPGDQPGDTWDVDILKPEILDSRASAVWDHIFEVREQERTAARAELAPFEQMMLNPTRQCVTRGVFELIEPYAFAPPCGRCPSCRDRKIDAPLRLPSSGLESAWPNGSATPGSLPGGPILLIPGDRSFSRGFAKLIERLARAGVEQFLVPEHLTGETAKLAASLCDLGLVLSADQTLAQTALAALPTALLLPSGDPLAEFLLLRIRQTSAKWPELPMIVVAPPDRLVSGRRLDQTVSSSAPISEDLLDRFSRPKEDP